VSQPIAFTPWRSIREGTSALSTKSLSFAEANESPCSTCSTAPCCTHLPVHSFRVSTLADLSYAGYLLNFDRIRLGLKPSGEWSVYYAQPCRFLDLTTFGCTIHNTPQQPQVCVQYNPYACWYKGALVAEVNEHFVLVDRARLSFLQERVTFDELRNIVSFPEWNDILEAFKGLSDEPGSVIEQTPHDLVFEEWRQIVAEENGIEASPMPVSEAMIANQSVSVKLSPPRKSGESEDSNRTYESLGDPCTGCSAPCCDTLTFSHGLPATISTLDFFKFCLGFEGVELFITSESWWIAIKSRCRHFTSDGRCGVYGSPERPLQCKYADAWKCTTRVEFGQPRPVGGLRVRLEHYSALTECVAFDDVGLVTEIADTSLMRRHIENRWAQSMAQQA
jgi:hypothetical protein